jgi:FHA domain/DUF1707 SHOCT-like domain
MGQTQLLQECNVSSTGEAEVLDVVAARWEDSGVGPEVSAPLPTRVLPRRPSAAERERVVRRLRRSRADERLSLDTFAARVELAYRTESHAELDELLADVPGDGPIARGALAAVGWVSWSTTRVRAAWRQPRTPRLVLPLQRSVVIGRSRRCACVLGDPTVSRKHARIRRRDGAWWLSDLGSMNGTYVNGARIVDDVEVRPGDEVAFGSALYRLAPASPPHSR